MLVLSWYLRMYVELAVLGAIGYSYMEYSNEAYCIQGLPTTTL